MDRMVISAAIPYIAKDFNLSPVAMGGVMSVFFVGYALCQIPGGMLADKFGSQKIMGGALVWWSAFTALTGWVGSLMSLLVVRVIFGIGEGLFPGAYYKSLANWFPVRERATANSIVILSNWGIPMTVLPIELMGASAATVNFGGQIAGFISPIVMGYLVQITGGSFNAAFIFIIAAAVAAALVSLVIKEQGLHTPVVELAKGSSPGSSAALGN